MYDEITDPLLTRGDHAVTPVAAIILNVRTVQMDAVPCLYMDTGQFPA